LKDSAAIGRAVEHQFAYRSAAWPVL